MSINELCVNLWKADVLKGFCVLSAMVLLWSWAILLSGWGAGLSPLPGFKTWPSNILLAASLSQISIRGWRSSTKRVLLFRLSWLRSGPLVRLCSWVQKSGISFPEFLRMWCEALCFMERESRVSLPCFHIPADTQWLPSTIAQHNLLGSGGIMKVTAAFQGISVPLTDVDVLYPF